MRQLDPGVHVRITGSKPNSGDRSRCVFTQREHGYDPHPEWFTDQLLEENRGFIEYCRSSKQFVPVLDGDGYTTVLTGHLEFREYCHANGIEAGRITDLTGIRALRVRQLWNGFLRFRPDEITLIEQALNVRLRDVRMTPGRKDGEQ